MKANDVRLGLYLLDARLALEASAVLVVGKQADSHALKNFGKCGPRITVAYNANARTSKFPAGV